MTSSMDDSDDEFDPVVPPDNELDKVQEEYICICNVPVLLSICLCTGISALPGG